MGTFNHRANDEAISMILNWDEHDRAKLTYQLLLSLEDTSPEEVALSREDLDQLWAEEAERRVAELDAGKIGCVSRDEAMRLARQDLGRHD